MIYATIYIIQRFSMKQKRQNKFILTQNILMENN